MVELISVGLALGGLMACSKRKSRSIHIERRRAELRSLQSAGKIGLYEQRLAHIQKGNECWRADPRPAKRSTPWAPAARGTGVKRSKEFARVPSSFAI